MKGESLERIREGIAAYGHEQKVIMRLLRKRGKFTSAEFDLWYGGRDFRRRQMVTIYGPGTFILDSHSWARNLEILQYMIMLGYVKVTKKGDIFIYEQA